MSDSKSWSGFLFPNEFGAKPEAVVGHFDKFGGDSPEFEVFKTCNGEFFKISQVGRIVEIA